VSAAEATILHADADAFFASVEQRDDPKLRGRPVLVGGGVVTAASYEARAYGVRGGMGGAQARRLCPHAIVVTPRWEAYVEASRALFRVFDDTAPVVEGLSLEEAFMDVGGMRSIAGSPMRIAMRLREEVGARVGLPVTVGIAPTKFLAKMASRVAKPDGLMLIPPGGELAFLHPLRVEMLWGVGEATASKLHRHRIRTVAELAHVAERDLVAIVGRAAGRHLHALAWARDPRRVRADSRRRSFGSQSAIGRGPHSTAKLDATLIGIADRVTRRMRAAGRAGRTVTLRLRFGDFARATRSMTIPQATAQTAPILAVARELLAAAMPLIEQRGITLLGLAISNLTARGAGIQLALPFERRDRVALDAAMDEVRERFGPTGLTRASLLGRDPGLAAWLVPRGSVGPGGPQ
jgi:DNA polymerase IV